MSIQFYHHHSPFELESGQFLPKIKVAYHTYGVLNQNCDNVIWICHALTADSNPAEWWSGIIGKGKLYDPDQYLIICANTLGSCYGSTGPLDINPVTDQPYYHTFPQISCRDIVNSFELLRVHLGITEIHSCVGGSLGGQQSVEWAISNPKIFKNLLLIATNCRHSSWGIAFNETQRMAISADQTWKNSDPSAGLEGMKAARAIALLSYRHYNTYQELQTESDANIMLDFKACTYQRYQGEKLTRKFNAFTYWSLTLVLDSHHVGRNRGSIENALAQITAKTLVVGVTTDVLFPINEQQFMAKHIKNAQFYAIDSIYGHDGFLIESDKIIKAIKDFYLS